MGMAINGTHLGGELGTAILLVAVAIFVAMVVVFVMLARETRRRRQKETLP